MRKQDIMEIFSIEKLEPYFPTGQIKKFIREAKRNPLPRGYEYSVLDKPIGSTKDCHDVYLVIASNKNDDSDKAIPICFIRRK